MTVFTDLYQQTRDILEKQGYAREWQDLLYRDCNLRQLFSETGLQAQHRNSPDVLRQRLRQHSREGKNEGATLVEACMGQDLPNVASRAAALKMVRHLHRPLKRGAQEVWVYSPPLAYAGTVFEEVRGCSKSISQKLDLTEEIFSQEEQEWMASSLQITVKICQDAVVKLAAADARTRSLVQRWFIDSANHHRLDEATAVLLAGFKKLSAACQAGSLVFTDYLDWREQRHKFFGGAYRGGEGGGFPVIYLEGAFTRLTGNTGKQWLCVETIIHEMSHHELETRDHRYDNHGLKPETGTFGFDKTIDNADNWGYFALDLAGYLSAGDFQKCWK